MKKIVVLLATALILFSAHLVFAADRGAINSGETKIGIPINPSSAMDTWTFSGTVNDRVIINAVTTSGSLDTQIDLYPPTGPIEASSNAGAWGGDQLDHALAQTGVYTIIIRDHSLNHIGTYNLTFLKIPGALASQEDPDGGPMAPGETLKGTINVPSDMDAFQFYAGGGQVVINAVTTSGTLDTQIDLYPPSGPIEASSNAGAWGADQLDHPLAWGGPGVYTIVIRDHSLSHTGSYSLTLLKFPGPVSCPGDLDGGDIASGDPPTRGSIGAPSDADVYQFWGQAGQHVIINAVTTSGNLDTQIDLYRPSGPIEASSNAGAWGGDQLDYTPLKETGLYSIVIRDHSLSHTGRYNVSLTKIQPALPPRVYDLVPGNGAVIVPPSVVLQWKDGGGATSFDVYLGTYVGEGIPRIAQNITAHSLQVNGLKWNERYYWGVIGHFAGGDVLSPARWFRVQTFGEMKKLPDGASVDVGGALITCAFDNFFSIESDDRSGGIRVDKASHGLSRYQRADVSGTLRTNSDGERYIDASSAAYPPFPKWRSIYTLGMSNRMLGGGDWYYNGATGAGQKGIAGRSGVNNIGLLVRTWGKFTKTSDTTFTLDDGSGVNVKCIAPSGVTLNSPWVHVAVTGMSSCEKVGSDLHRLIRATDITPL